MERDYFMTAAEAVEYGIIDTVLSHRPRRGVKEASAVL